ncbi:MAG TPA: L-dopachrome tautomerase-related protein [Alphaproteobacteria bacterium]|nr:L-dopachrome tautomerase-related protein [Alphaproteobacteria bacterium]HNS44654.1 L-dopachrome tautomerase-related protein [Alphaproteobacteria bacterium]
MSKVPALLSVIGLLMVGGSAVCLAAETTQPALEVVAQLDQRPANLAVTSDGDIIVSLHPFDNPSTQLLMIKSDGTQDPFPSKEWNSGQPDLNGLGFVNVIGVRCTPSDEVIALDIGDKDHAPRMVFFNLGVQQATREVYIPRDFTTDQSFLQDFAYDWEKDRAYIADMGQADLSAPAHPALIDVAPSAGWVRRVLPDFEEFMPPEKPLEIGGKVLRIEKDGKEIPVRAALNSITIDPQMDWLYFAPMGEGKLYRVPISRVSDMTYSKDDILKRLEVVSDKKPASDGITVDSAGNVYVAAIGKGEIGVITPDGEYKTYIKDDRLDWVDGFSFGPDGYLYATVSQLDRAPFFNKGEDKSQKPFLIVRFKPLADGVMGR